MSSRRFRTLPSRRRSTARSSGRPRARNCLRFGTGCISCRCTAKPDDVAPPPRPAPETATWEKQWVPDDVLLFRYSALTFNGHRIHYDRRYVTEVEKYPGLIVHGPLLATLLLDLLRHQAPRAEV